MITGFQGTFVISWTQTEVDGLSNAPKGALGIGSSWRWSGEALRVDGPKTLLLSGAEGEADTRRRAAKIVHKLVGAALHPNECFSHAEVDDPLLNIGFEVTDGRESYKITIIESALGMPDLLMFVGMRPPVDMDLWVVRTSMQISHINRMTDQPTGVICFTPGTRIRLEDGEKPVEQLAEGDRIQTRDNGAQKVLWIGVRHISGARLYAMPELRPVRIRADALGMERPDQDLIVSPQHRMLIKGARARDLFNEDEVLIAAEDLVDDRKVVLDHSLRQVTYYHMLLENHELVWANGVETESFHPANTALDSVESSQRARLIEMFPALEFDPLAYGDYARRNLDRYEAAILQGYAA